MAEIKRGESTQELQIPDDLAFYNFCGRFDSTNSQIIQDDITSKVKNDPKNIVISLDRVEYLSVAGLRELVTLLKECKTNNCDVRLANPSERTRELIDMAGLDTIFQIYPTETEAIESFNS